MGFRAILGPDTPIAQAIVVINGVSDNGNHEGASFFLTSDPIGSKLGNDREQRRAYAKEVINFMLTCTQLYSNSRTTVDTCLVNDQQFIQTRAHPQTRPPPPPLPPDQIQTL